MMRYLLPLLLAVSAVLAAPQPQPGTNADRLARGLALNKPGRLFNPRRAAARPRASYGPTVQIATSPLTNNPLRKRSPVSESFFCVDGAGNIRATDDSSLADEFFYSDSTQTSLLWQATKTIAGQGIVSGSAYPVQASAVSLTYSNVFRVIIGGPATVGASNLPLGSPRYTGDVNTKPNGLDYQWWEDPNSGYVGISNDYVATYNYLSNYYDNNVKPLGFVVETFTSLAAVTTLDAMNWYYLGESMINPVSFYATSDGVGEGYFAMDFTNGVTTLTSPGTGGTPFRFYMPLLQSGQGEIPIVAVANNVYYQLTPSPYGASGYDHILVTLYDPTNYGQALSMINPGGDPTNYHFAIGSDGFWEDPNPSIVVNLVPDTTTPPGQSQLCVQTVFVGGNPGICVN